jgi:hypothetical protein
MLSLHWGTDCSEFGRFWLKKKHFVCNFRLCTRALIVENFVGSSWQSCRSESPRSSLHVAAAFVPETKAAARFDAPAGCATAVRVGTAVVLPAERRSAQALGEICPQRKTIASMWVCAKNASHRKSACRRRRAPALQAGRVCTCRVNHRFHRRVRRLHSFMEMRFLHGHAQLVLERMECLAVSQNFLQLFPGAEVYQTRPLERRRRSQQGFPCRAKRPLLERHPAKMSQRGLCCSVKMRCVESKAITLSAPEHRELLPALAALSWTFFLVLFTCRPVVPPLHSPAPSASPLPGVAAYPPRYRCA